MGCGGGASGRGAFVTGEIGQLWGAHWVYVVWRENRHVRAGGGSARNGSGVGVGMEFGGSRGKAGAVECGVFL